MSTRLRAPFVLPLALSITLTLLFAAGRLLPSASLFASQQAYLPFHITLEFMSIAVSGMVFALAWSLMDVSASGRVYVLGLTSLTVAVLDLVHTLSFPGMPELVTPADTEKAIFFWLFARLLAGLGLMAAVFVPDRPRSRSSWYAGIVIAAVTTILIITFGLTAVDAFPRTFVPGTGLTGFKIGAEYVIAGLHVIAAIGLVGRARRHRDVELGWLAGAAWVLALAEMFLTLYGTVTDVFNLLGHVYKSIAYLMIYRGLFMAGVREPYVRLDRESSLLRSLIDSVPDPVSFKDTAGRFLGANRAWFEISGLAPSDIVGRTWEDVQSRSRAQHASRRRTNLAGGIERFEERVVVEGQPETIYDTLFVPYVGPNGEAFGSIEVRRDITAAKVAEQRIEQLALYDQLTGLPNRVFFEENVEALLADVQRRSGQMALIYLDLDDFRAINDSLGHSIGDLVLQEAANRIYNLLPVDGSMSRLGGDEYGLAIPIARVHEATAFIEQVRHSICEPMHIERHEFAMTASMGVAVAPVDGTTFDALRRNADAALVKAKSEGHDVVRFFTQDLQDQAARRLRLAAGLRRAIENDELRLAYQPQVSAGDRRIVGVEALIRWEHPEYGLLSPSEFIPIAEDTGLILPIGDWVLDTALRDACDWDRAGATPFTMAVNISAVQFRQLDLADRVHRALERHAFPAQRLDIEITETVAMHNPELAAEAVERLHELGVLFSIDDFGTGYSSLAYLKRFRVNRLKIDRSFVADLGANPESAAIVTAIIEVARALQCRTIAEGVETTEQVEHLELLRCDLLQGYYFSRPVPAAEMGALLVAAAQRES